MQTWEYAVIILAILTVGFAAIKAAPYILDLFVLCYYGVIYFFKGIKTEIYILKLILKNLRQRRLQRKAVDSKPGGAIKKVESGAKSEESERDDGAEADEDSTEIEEIEDETEENEGDEF